MDGAIGSAVAMRGLLCVKTMFGRVVWVMLWLISVYERELFSAVSTVCRCYVIKNHLIKIIPPWSPDPEGWCGRLCRG